MENLIVIRLTIKRQLNKESPGPVQSSPVWILTKNVEVFQIPVARPGVVFQKGSQSEVLNGP